MSAEPTDLDYALLRRVARGEAPALAELIRRHQTRLYHLAYRLLKDPLDAEDALQEVFIKVYEHAATFEPKAPVSAWLNRITANHCLNRLRQRRFHFQHSFFDDIRRGSLERGVNGAALRLLPHDAVAAGELRSLPPASHERGHPAPLSGLPQGLF